VHHPRDRAHLALKSTAPATDNHRVNDADERSPAAPGAIRVVDDPLDRTLSILRSSQRISLDLMRHRDLASTLQSVADGALGLGFRAAVLNLVRDDGLVEVVATAGPDSLRQTLLGQVSPVAEWLQLLATCEVWGALHYLPDLDKDFPMTSWVMPESERATTPAAPAEVGEVAWQHGDSLFAAMHDEHGQLVGVISVDEPEDGRRPGRLQRALIELFSAQARVAVESARAHQRAAVALARADQQTRLFRSAFDAAPNGVGLLSARPGTEGVVLRANEALLALLGQPADRILGSTLADHLHPGERLDAPTIPATGTVDRRERRYLTAEGDVLWIAQSSSTVADEDGLDLYEVVHLVDITASKSREHTLARDALHDPLSGLANRRALHERLADLRDDEPVAVLFFDLNDFKAVNDTRGHALGDRLLVEVGRRITSCVRAGDLVARYGGDEFVVLAPGLSAEDAEQLRRRIVEAVAAPLPDDLAGVRVSTSAGVAYAGAGSATTAAALLELADHRMLTAKPSRRGR
jgi:diguanylate cyclase (GGDEF)-like protein/PAS domain S-box-containing protein